MENLSDMTEKTCDLSGIHVPLRCRTKTRMYHLFKEKHAMKQNVYGKIALFVSVLTISVFLSGCVVCHKDEQYTGIEDTKLKEIECGQTTKDWLILCTSWSG